MNYYKSGEPKFLGKISVRSEMEVLPEDNSSPSTIGWKCSIVSGGEIFKYDVQDQLISEVLTKKEDLFPGAKILAPTLFGDLIVFVQKNEKGELKAISKSGQTLIILDFDQDDRHCWTTSMAINLKALDKFKL